MNDRRLGLTDGTDLPGNSPFLGVPRASRRASAEVGRARLVE